MNCRCGAGCRSVDNARDLRYPERNSSHSLPAWDYSRAEGNGISADLDDGRCHPEVVNKALAAEGELPGRVGSVERISVHIPVHASREVHEGVACEELSGGGVVVAGSEVLEAGFCVGVVAGILEWVADGSGGGGEVPVGVVGEGGDDG